MAITLSDHQQEVFDKLLTDINESITTNYTCFIGSLYGPAGSGKTVLISKLTQLLHSKYDELPIRVTAPTHQAVKVIRNTIKGNTESSLSRVSYSTIHSYLSLKADTSQEVVKFIPDFTKGSLVNTKILIIDESSMVSEEIFDYIIDNADKRKLKAVIFVGDKMQLIPVDGDGNTVSVYSKIPQYGLSEVVRQARDNHIIKKTIAIRECIEKQNFDLDVLSFSEIAEECENIKVYDDMATWFKKYLASEDDKVISAFTNKSVNKYNEIIRFKEYNSKDLPKIIAGELVVLQEPFQYGTDQFPQFINNGEVLDVVNPVLRTDAMGINYWEFETSDYKGVFVRVLDVTSEAEFSKELQQLANNAKGGPAKERGFQWSRFWKRKAEYVDIKYAFAYTIHKLQGSTYNEVYFNLRETIQCCGDRDLDMLFRLVYVALTRARHTIYVAR
jgi:energy-coupling factor transporter ATP-binding protein EcfA2